MNHRLFIPILLFATLFLVAAFERATLSYTTIKGILLDAKTSAPVKDAYIYVVRGEEEALSNDKGAFSLQTSSKDNLTLHVEHPNYKPYKGTHKPGAAIRILLQPLK